MRATENVVSTIKVLTTHFHRPKQNVLFFYCLLVHIMYIIHNKAMFTISENPKVYIKNNINPINTHLLALECIEYRKW